MPKVCSSSNVQNVFPSVYVTVTKISLRNKGRAGRVYYYRSYDKVIQCAGHQDNYRTIAASPMANHHPSLPVNRHQQLPITPSATCATDHHLILHTQINTKNKYMKSLAISKHSLLFSEQANGNTEEKKQFQQCGQKKKARP